MVILLLLLTFLICAGLDWYLSAGTAAARQPRPATEAGRKPEPPRRQVYAGGFLLDDDLRFHPGHAWAVVEGPGRLRVGLDEFACRLLGGIDQLELPQPGARVVQGKPAWVALHRGRRAPMLSPVSGEVICINPQAVADPRVVAADPCGIGWLFSVRCHDLRANLSNLFGGELARQWMEHVAARLRVMTSGGTLTFPDGGSVVADLAATVADDEWPTLVREFLLTDATPPSASAFACPPEDVE